MKLLCALMLCLICASASAEVLTEANMPKFDIEASCATAPAAKLAPTFMNYCVTTASSARAHLLGADIAPQIVAYCADDTRVHDPIYTYAHLADCIRSEQARPILEQTEAIVMSAPRICDRASGARKNECELAELRWHDRIKADPTDLNKAGVSDCIARLHDRDIVSWDNISTCMSRPDWRAGG